MNAELYPSILQKTQQSFRDNYLLQASGILQKSLSKAQDLKKNIISQKANLQQLSENINLQTLNDNLNPLKLNEQEEKERMKSEIIAKLKEKGNYDEEQIEANFKKALEEQETVQRGRQALRDLKKEYSQKAVDFMQIYNESLQ